MLWPAGKIDGAEIRAVVFFSNPARLQGAEYVAAMNKSSYQVAERAWVVDRTLRTCARVMS